MNRSSGLVVRITQYLGVSLALLLCSAWSGSAFADPPGRVARLADLSGQVWLYSPDAGEWIAAERNRPLTDGDRVSTDAGARAEVRVGSTTLRLDAGSELEVLAIDDDHVSLELHSGSVAARLRTAEAAREFEMKTAEGRFLAQRPGAYRFDRNDGTSHVTVWKGQAQYEGPGSALTVNANQRAEFWIDRNNAAQYTLGEPQSDAFATWNGERDRQDDRTASTRYVSPEMTGVEDLDRYGRWEQAPDYGNVWVPTSVPSGWAPYGAGNWAWVSPWGWTWVDAQPWGFAPFHYGRWVNYRSRWCWVPGTYVRRPVYAPALVGWVGGSHLSVSISIGGGGPAVGWFPLAPREVYVPTYRVSPTYVRNVNVTHVTNITNVTTIINNPQLVVNNTNYQNRRFPHAVTVVPQSVLANRQPVGPAAAQLRDNPRVREFVSQPVQKTALVAPPVAAPQISPQVIARRAQEQQARGADPRRAGGPGNAGVAAQPLVPLPPSRLANTPARQGGDPDRERRGRDPREELRARASAQPTQIAPVQPDPRIGATPPAPNTPTPRTAATPPAPNAPAPHTAVVPPAPAAPPHVTSTLPPAPATAPTPQVAQPSPRVVPPPNRVNVGAPQAQNPREPPAPVAVPAPTAPPAAVPPQRPTATPVPPAEPRGRQRGEDQRSPVGMRAPQPDPNAAAAQQAQAARAETQGRAQTHQVQVPQEAQARAAAQSQAQAQAQAQIRAQQAQEAHVKAQQEKQRKAAVEEARDDPKRGEQRR